MLVVIAALALFAVPLASSSPQETEGEPPRELEEFVPSEEITADSAVSFPVDI